MPVDKTEKILGEIGNRLRVIRESKRLTQKAVAEAMNVRPHQYGLVENGKVVPSLKTLVMAADVLEIGLDEVVYGAKPLPSNITLEDDKMASRIKTINSLEGEDYKIALQLLDLIVVKKKFKDMVVDLHS